MQPLGAAEREAVWGRLRALPVPVRELLAGGVAGGIAKTAIAPLERCKILFQTGKLRGASLAPTLAHIYGTEGVQGLFRGNGASVLRIVPYAAVHYYAYEQYRRLLVGAVGLQEHRVPPVLDLLAGSAAGASAVLLTYPLDLVRTRLAYMTEAGAWPQQQQHSTSSSSSRGAAGVPLQAAAASQAAGAESAVARAGAAGHPPLHHYGSSGLALASSRGSSSGTCSSSGGSSGAARLAAGPLRPSSTSIGSPGCGSRLQGQGVGAPRGLHLLPPHALAPRHTIRGVLAGTLQREGLRGVYHGVGASMYGILPYAGLKFYIFQHLKQWYHHAHRGEVTRTGVDGKPRLPVPVMLSFGGVAGLVAQTFTYPLDVVRRQMQVEGLRLQEVAADAPSRQLASGSRQLSLRSTPQALLLLARQHGWRCLYAGLSINYLKVVPSTAIGFTAYDYIKSSLALPTNL